MAPDIEQLRGCQAPRYVYSLAQVNFQMSLYTRYKWLLLLSFFLVAIQIAEYSFSRPQGVDYLMTVSKHTDISPQEAAAIVQQSVGGRVLSVSHESSHYRVKVLNDRGHIQIITVDARSGAILSAR